MIQTTIIIDDEHHAIELLKGYVNRVPFLNCIATFRNPITALSYLNHQSVDLIFLDINMPELSGLAFLKTLQAPPTVILTTAYSEYAVESYEYQVADYLLKPIAFERFLKAVTQVQQRTQLISSDKTPQKDQYIYIKDGYDNIKIRLNDILYLKKDGNYITYYTAQKSIISRQTIQQALDVLGEDFMQIHKSFIVNLQKIEAFSAQSVSILGNRLPIGLSFKKELARRI